MATFTTEELALIRQDSKSEEDLPTYYSAENKIDTQISREFESYLILQSPAQKQRILSWISSASSVQKPKIDRDDLTNKYIALRKADAQSRIDELSQQTNQFESLRSELVGDST